MMKQRWKRWVSLLLTGVMLTFVLTSCSGGGGQGSGSSGGSGVSRYEAEVIRLVNEIRVQEGLSPLTTTSALSAAADQRAKELVSCYAHERPDGTSCFTALHEFGVSYRAAGENIAAGYPTPEAVVTGWMNSSGHRANILNPSFKAIGVGHVSGRGSYGFYWVQMFIG